ncbi:MAG: hypothetical protein ACFFE8_12580 [Candidatus Heimdallarchaeota archaeon]
MEAVFIAGVTELGPGIFNIWPRTILDESQEIELALKILPAGGKEGDLVVVSFKKEFKAAAVIIKLPAFEESQDVRGSFAAFGFLLGENVNSLPYQNILREIIGACTMNNILTVSTLKRLCPELFNTLSNSENLKLRISPDVVIELPFNPQKSTGERLRDAMKRL